jgi:hypothetical protein
LDLKTPARIRTPKYACGPSPSISLQKHAFPPNECSPELFSSKEDFVLRMSNNHPRRPWLCPYHIGSHAWWLIPWAGRPFNVTIFFTSIFSLLQAADELVADGLARWSWGRLLTGWSWGWLLTGWSWGRLLTGWSWGWLLMGWLASPGTGG